MTNYLWNHKLLLLVVLLLLLTHTFIHIYTIIAITTTRCFSSSNLRLVTYNVHRFEYAGQNTVRKIKSHLSSLRPVPHIIALNEVNVVEKPKALDMIAEELNMKYEFFGHVGEGRYGHYLPVCQLNKKRNTFKRWDRGSISCWDKKLNGDIAKAGEKHELQEEC